MNHTYNVPKQLILVVNTQINQNPKTQFYERVKHKVGEGKQPNLWENKKKKKEEEAEDGEEKEDLEERKHKQEQQQQQQQQQEQQQ